MKNLKKNIGILYDNISGNTGDVAIGLSLRKIMRNLNIDFEELVPGNFNPDLYHSIIIGGGHLLRKNHDFYYDKFKVKGKHILNAMGIVDFPTDLEYLDNYRYLSFRSTGDKGKASYIKKESSIVPCTTMLLEDLNECPIKIDNAAIGIHLIPNAFSEEEEALFINWVSSLPYNVYFIPITHYNNDYNYMYKLSKKIKNACLLPIMKPLEIFTLIGRFHYVITCSLHGSIFSYIHNVSFILMDQEKSRFFLEDRGLERYLFNSLEDIIRLSEEMLNNTMDYSTLIIKDKIKLNNHIENIKENIPKGTTNIVKENKNISDESLQVNHQVYFLQTKIDNLKLENYKLKLENSNLNNKINELSAENNVVNNELINLNADLIDKQNNIIDYQVQLDKIHNSKGWRLLKVTYKSIDEMKGLKNKFRHLKK